MRLRWRREARSASLCHVSGARLVPVPHLAHASRVRRKRRLLGGALALALLGTTIASGCGRAGSGMAPGKARDAGPTCDGQFDPNAVTAVLEAQSKAWNDGDIEGFLGGYERSEALVFTSGGHVRRGFEETRTKFRARYGSASDSMGHLSFDMLDVRGLGRCRDAAVVLGRWRVTDSAEAGSGVFSVLLERDAGGAWHIVHDHTSSDPEPLPPGTDAPPSP